MYTYVRIRIRELIVCYPMSSCICVVFQSRSFWFPDLQIFAPPGLTAPPLLTVHTILLYSFIFFFFCEQKGLSVHTFFLSGKTYLKLSMRFYVFCFVLFFLHVIGNVRMKSQANDDVPWELKVIGYGINWGYFRVFRKSNAKTKIKWVHFHLLGSQCIESGSLKILQIIT